MTSLIKKTGESWTRNELKKVLGKLHVNPDDSTLVLMRCPLNETHKPFNLLLDVKDDVLDFSGSCRDCGYKMHVANPELTSAEISEQLRMQLLNWFKKRELIDGRWFPHSNPYDLDGSSPVLSFLADEEGSPLLYNAAIHILYGKPGTLKSWLALSTLTQADVRLWDFENGAYATRDRLEKLNIPREQCNGYLVPQSPEEIFDRVEEYLETQPDLVVIDGFSGLAEMLGINPESNHEVMTIFNRVLFPLRASGISVLILDHLPKDAASEDFPIGAQAKKSQSDVALLVKQKSGSDGMELFVAKDRFGQLSRRCEEGSQIRRFGKVELKISQGLFEVGIRPSYQAEIAGSDLSTYDANQMQDIWNYVNKNPNCTKGDIESGVIGKHDRKRRNLQMLVDTGYIKSSKLATALIHEVIKPLHVSWTPLGS